MQGNLESLEHVNWQLRERISGSVLSKSTSHPQTLNLFVLQSKQSVTLCLFIMPCYKRLRRQNRFSRPLSGEQNTSSWKAGMLIYISGLVALHCGFHVTSNHSGHRNFLKKVQI
jgi:hypothetical protein